MIILRKLARADATAYRDLRLLALRESSAAFGSSYEQESVHPLEFFEGRLAEDTNRIVMGAFDRDRLVGVVVFVRDDGIKARHRGAIYSMYVHPEWRRRKIGRMMLQELLTEVEQLPGMRWLRLTVTAGNDSAQRLYESLGFTVYAEEPEVLFIDGVFYAERHMLRKIPLNPS